MSTKYYPGLRFTGVHKSHCFNHSSRFLHGSCNPSLYKALFTQQWHLHTPVEIETELFNAFLSYMLLSVPIWGGHSTEISVYDRRRECTWADVLYQNISSGNFDLQRSWIPWGTQLRWTALKTVAFYNAAWPSKLNRESAFWKCTVWQVFPKSD